MNLEDIVSILDRVGFIRTDIYGTMDRGFTKSVNGKNFFYWFGRNTGGEFTITKQGDNYVHGITEIKIFISYEFPNEYKEYKRDMKLKQLGI